MHFSVLPWFGYFILLGIVVSGAVPFNVFAVGAKDINVQEHELKIFDVVIDTASCYLTVLGEKDQPHYTAFQGVEILSTEVLQSNCLVENFSSSTARVVPTYETYVFNERSATVTATGGDTGTIILAPYEKRLVVTTLPKPVDPQLYLVNLSYGERSNEIPYSYFLQRGEGTAQNVQLDKDRYRIGETATISFSWVPAPALVQTSRTGVGTEILDTSYTLSLLDERGVACTSPITGTLMNEKKDVRSNVVTTASCVHPRVMLTFISRFGEVVPPAEGGLVKNIESVSTESQPKGFWTVYMWSTAFFSLMLILLGVFTLCKKKMPLLIVVLIFTAFTYVGDVYADSINCSAGCATYTECGHPDYYQAYSCTWSPASLCSPDPAGQCGIPPPPLFCPGTAPCATGTWAYEAACPSTCGQPSTSQDQVCMGGNGMCDGAPDSRTCPATAACPPPTGTWSYPSACPSACGQPETNQTETCTGGNGYCAGSAGSRWCPATGACPVVGGTCGAAATTYSSEALGYSGSYCATSYGDSGIPPFPAIGGSSNWYCKNSVGVDDVYCTATRSPSPSVVESATPCEVPAFSNNCVSIITWTFFNPLQPRVYKNSGLISTDASSSGLPLAMWYGWAGNTVYFWEDINGNPYDATIQELESLTPVVTCTSGTSWNGSLCMPVTPSAPTGLTATPQACNSGQNFLNWNDVPSATSYSIYNASTGVWIGNSVGSNYTHTGSMSTLYNYYVRANNFWGTQSANSATFSGTTLGACAIIPPIADAGDDRSITLPVNSVAASGASASDPDGSVASTIWTVTSGPVVAGITNATTLTPTFTGMNTAGTYVFRLRVTDNQGNVTDDTVSVYVNPVPQCADGFDNSDPEDTLIDMADTLGCSSPADTDETDTSVPPIITINTRTNNVIVVNPGDTVTIGWNTQGADESLCSITASVGTAPTIPLEGDITSGTVVTDNIYARTIFTFTCPGGSDSKTIELISGPVET